MQPPDLCFIGEGTPAEETLSSEKADEINRSLAYDASASSKHVQAATHALPSKGKVAREYRSRPLLDEFH